MSKRKFDNNDALSSLGSGKKPKYSIDAAPPDLPFTPKYEIAETDRLSVENGHPRDCHIRFYEEDHKYEIQWDSGSKFTSEGVQSVSAFYGKYFPSFNPTKCIQRMQAGQNWVKSKYYGMSDDEIKRLWKNAG